MVRTGNYDLIAAQIFWNVPSIFSFDLLPTGVHTVPLLTPLS